MLRRMLMIAVAVICVMTTRPALAHHSTAAFVDTEASNHETLENQLAFAIKTAPKLTIQGGTTEVLRGIIARGLGLR